MTDRGTPTPEDVANKSRRRVNAAKAFLLAGFLVGSAGLADLAVTVLNNGGFSNTPATTLVFNYEDTEEALARAGQLDQLPGKFDPQQLAQAYKAHDAEEFRADLDLGAMLAGTAGLFVGAGLLPRRNR